MKRPKLSPALILFFLAPTIGELLSGSSPPAEFFTLFGFTILTALYGSGAIIVRELRIRWKKGIGSMLLLGAAYGVLEEGLITFSFFNPNWMDLGQMGVYGRWLGVNWVWAEMLIIFHAVYSTTIPIILVELAFPKKSNESWIGRKTFAATLTLLGGVTVFGFLLFSTFLDYWTPLPQYIFGIALMFAFGYTAHKLPSNWGQNGNKPLLKPRIMWSAGTLGSFAFFLGYWLMPTIIPFWQMGMLFGPFLILVYSRFLKRYDWKTHATTHKFALVSGALTFFIMFAVLQELDKSRPDNTSGMAAVGLAALIVLALLRRRIGKQMQHDEKQLMTEHEVTGAKLTREPKKGNTQA